MVKQLFVVIAVVLMMCVSTVSMSNTFDVNSKTSTAWSPEGMNDILTKVYGYKLVSPSNTPSGYLKGQKFGESPTAWSPIRYHEIFTAYGLVLNENRINTLGWIDYCKLVNGKVVWAKGSYAYSPRILDKIIGVYDLPAPPPRDDDKDGVVNKIDKCPKTPYGAKVDDRGCWVLDGVTLFAFDSSIVNAAYLPQLEDIARVFNYEQNLKMVVTLDGHTDSVGTEKYNEALSMRRAASVKKVLVEMFGIDTDRITVIGYGETNPIDTNDTAEGRQKNRRVELTPVW